jgi:aspartyl-tRNA(Asn)/glutamyl-tRNA(Gln) amidotransferase subunit B
MEEGSLRCDANISLRPAGEKKLGTKAEIKNMNSFKSVQKGLEYEIERQKDVLDSGGRVIQETRGFDDVRGITVSMRSKEQAHDYRYFPDPDLVPVVVDEEWVRNIKNSLPELPDERKRRLMSDMGLSDYDAAVITASKEMADYYDEIVKAGAPSKQAANWLMGDVSKSLNTEGIGILECPVTAEKLSNLIKLIENGTISGKIAKTVFEEMWQTGKDAMEVVKEKGLVQISDESAIVAAVEEAILKNPQTVADFKAGKEKALGFLVGQIMKQTKGRANPDLVNKLLKERL